MMEDSLLRLNSLLNLFEALLDVKETNNIKCIKLNSKTIDNLPVMRPSNEEKGYGYTFEIRGIPIETDETLKDSEVKFELKNKKDELEYEIDNILQRMKEKERFKLSIMSGLRDNLDYYGKIGRSDLYETCKKELKNITDEEKFLFDLILDIEKIKDMVDEIK